MRDTAVKLITGFLFVSLMFAQPSSLWSQDEPVVEEEKSPLPIEPTETTKIFDSAVLMLELGRPTLARRYIDQFLAKNPTDAQLVNLYEKHGPTTFLQMERVPELKAVMTPLLDRINATFKKRNFAKLEPMIDNVSSDDAGDREAAILTLKSMGEPALPAMIRRLAATRNLVEKDRLVQALVRMGPIAVPALIGALESPDPEVRSGVLGALGFLADRRAAPHIWSQAFGPKQPAGVQYAGKKALARIFYKNPERLDQVNDSGVAHELREIALVHFQNNYDWNIENGGTVKLWVWVPQAETVAPVDMTPEVASLHMGARFSRQSLELTSDHKQSQALFLGMNLAVARHLNGWDTPLPTGPGTIHDTALVSGADLVTDSLRLALKHGNASTAIATISLLGKVGTRNLVYSSGPDSSPLIAALNYPDPRVQFAAAETILELDPRTAFPYSNRVVDIFARALKTDGVSKALVVHPNSQEASTTGGFLGRIGYEPVVATTGQSAFRMIAERSDIEIVFLHANTQQWALTQTIANLRKDPRTTPVPIVIYGPANVQQNVASLIARYPRVGFMQDSLTDEFFQGQFRELMKGLKSPPLTPEQQGAQAESAAFWLAHIANGQRTNIYNLRPVEESIALATENPKLVSNALVTLAAIPSVSAQTTLQSVAVNTNRTPKEQELGALQLAFHIQKYGLLLTKTELDQVKAAFDNATDPNVSTALAAVLGSLKPNANQVGEELKKYENPPLIPQP